MQSPGFINVIAELIGWPVVEAETSVTLGAVTDVAVHPTDGTLTGLMMLTNQGKQAAITTGYFQFNELERKVYTLLDALLIGDEIELYLRESVAVCSNLLACEIVTHEGELLGQVSQAYVAVTQPPRLVYRITAPGLQRFFKRGLYLAAASAYFYSGGEHRLFVPAMSAELLCHSLDEAARIPLPQELGRRCANTVKQTSH